MAESVAKIRLALEGQPAVVAGIKEVERQFGSLKSGMAGLVSGLTIGALAAVVKNAINAADEMSKLSQKTGVAVKDLAGLQLAFQQSGLGGDVLEKSMARLGRSMADGNKAFAAMGVSVKAADGALRPMRDVLGDVADRFASYADGAAKTALAQEVFGKSGAEMIPLLNSGSDALAEMDDWARRLGLTMSEESAKQAEQFNDTLDLLGMGVQGVWRQIAAQMLPTLTTLASEMLNSATDTGALTTASAVLGNTLKGLYTVAASGIQIFSNLGRFVGAAAAAIVAVTQGNFAGAKDIMAQVQVDNATAWQKQVDSLKRLWNDAGGAGVQAMATVAAAANRAAPIVEKPGNSARKSLKEAKDVAMELYQQLTMKDVGLDPKFFEQLNQLHGLYTSGRIGIDEYRKAVELLTEKQEFAKQLRQDLINQSQLANQIAEQAIDAEEKHRQTVEGQIKTGREMLENIKFETAALQMTNAEREVAIALRELERQGIVDGTEAYAAYAEQIREAVLNKDAVEASIESQRQIEEEWRRTSDQIGQQFTDALIQGGASVKEALKRMFQNLVLRPIIQPIMTAIGGGVASLIGGPAMAGQGGGSGLLGLGVNLFGAGGFAGSLMAGAGWLTGATTLGGSLAAAGSLIGTGTLAGAGAGLGMALGAAAPILAPLALLAMSGAFSRKHAQHNLEGVFGGETGFEGNWHDYYKGGLLRSSKTVDTPLDSATLNALRGAWKAQEAMVIDYAETLGLATDKIEGFTFKINLKLKDLGDPEAAGYMDKVWQMVNEAIATGSNEMAERIIGTWTTTTREVEETIKTGFWDDETFTTVKKTVEETTYTASEYAREGERAIDTLTRLATSLQATNAAFDMLGLSLYEASLAGADMASKLIDQMGGMDAFGAQVSAYWQNYYTEAERHAYMTGKMTEALAAAGLEMPTTVAGFRALVDAQDLTTDAGRAAFTALMSVNAAFTEVYGNADAAAGSIAGLGDELAAMEPSLHATNVAFDMLGLTLFEASLAGGDMASSLVDLMGGIESFNGLTSSYFQNFYTEAERNEYAVRMMTKALEPLGLTLPTTTAEFRRLVEAQDLTTDAGRAAFTALMSVNAAFTEVYGNADAAAGSIVGLGDELAAMEPIVFGAASDLASVIEQGLLGTLTGAALGEQMADVVIGGVYNAIAGGFAQQITTLMIDGVVNPMLMAAATGANMSVAVSQAAIDTVVQQAQAAAAAMNAVLNDPGFQAAMAQVAESVRSISFSIERPAPVYDSYAAQRARAAEYERLAQQQAAEAARAAEQQAREAQRIADEQAREAQRLAEEELRRISAVAGERAGILRQLLQLEGDVTTLRQGELLQLDPSNRALQQRVWALEDEKKRVEEYTSALTDAGKFLDTFTRSISDFIQQVLQQQATVADSYNMAAARFSAQMTLARAGDRDAMSGITGHAGTLIEAIRRDSTTGDEANLRIARVLGQLASLPAQISPEQLIVDAIGNLSNTLVGELIAGFGAVDTNLDNQLTFAELQTALAGKATDSQIQALISEVDTNADGQISRLELIKANTASTSTNVSGLGTDYLNSIKTSTQGTQTNVSTLNSTTSSGLSTIGSNTWSTSSNVSSYGSGTNSRLDSLISYNNVQNAGQYADFRSDYQTIRLAIDNVYNAIQAVRGGTSPLYVKSETRGATPMTFWTGGYTGDGGKHDFAGFVHKGEGVLNQEEIRLLGGPAGFESLRQSLRRGYADGGIVAAPVPVPVMRGSAGEDSEIKLLLRRLVDAVEAGERADRERNRTLQIPLDRVAQTVERIEVHGVKQRDEAVLP